MQVTRVDQVLLGVAALLLLGLGVIGWSALAADTDGPAPSDAGQPGIAVIDPAAGPVASTPQAPVSTTIVVDVQGAVLRPGLYHLVAGARVGDAIAAAGGYDSSVDLDAAAIELNLAALLNDGDKIIVPRLQPEAAGGSAGGDTQGSGEGGGLVNVNTADAAALEALPGIGPVTVDKIIAAREEAPFQSLDEMVERGVINRGQLDKIRDLATTG